VARIAGDEFVVTGVGGPDDAQQLAQQIQTAFQTPAQLPGLELAVAASIGVALRTDQTTAEGLLRDADLAMYRAKAEGRNRITVFQPAMRQTVRDRVEIELALRQAISRGQLWVAYQPIVDTLTGRTVGAEALLRWAHPVRGSISPAEFIPVAEETGLIVEVGTWVLRESLRQLAEWRSQGLLPADFRLSVNASARQISDRGFHELVRSVLEEFGLAAGQLIIEITESVMMDSPETIVDRLLALRAMGVSLSVDDFGTGYSSLSYLSHFPVTGVKIDRSFVADLGQDERAGAIVRAVVAMAKALGLSLVAEGIETDEQRTELCRLGVDHGQGWLWSPALPSLEFADSHLESRETSRSDAQAGSGNS
jgi:EAL domain-containing protein (putative c-di-GMP-specific phosphodiesterase class I)